MKYLIKNINDIKDIEYELFYNRLPIQEKERINKKLNKTDKKRSLLGLLLLEELLKKDINTLIITRSKNNKPYLKNSNIYFNISHKKDYVVTVISNNQIGIDIEYIDENKINLNTLKYFSTETEEKNIKKCNNFKTLYFTLFSLKESYIKMKDILFDKNIIEFEISNNKIKNTKKDIDIKILNNIDNYVITICEKNE